MARFIAPSPPKPIPGSPPAATESVRLKWEVLLFLYFLYFLNILYFLHVITSLFPRFFRRYPIYPHIRPQNLRHHNRPVRLLIILHNRNPRPPNRQPRPIQRVHKFALSPALRLKPYPRPPRLERLAVRARRNFHVIAARRQPRLNVIRLRRRKPRVPRTEQHHAVVNSQFLQQRLCILHQRLVLFVTLLRR